MQLVNPKEAPNAPIVALKRAESVEIQYAVLVRPFARELLKSLVNNFHLIIYSDDYWSNLTVLS